MLVYPNFVYSVYVYGNVDSILLCGMSCNNAWLMCRSLLRTHSALKCFCITVWVSRPSDAAV